MAKFVPVRRHPRSPCDRPLRFLVGKNLAYEGICRNLSQGGLGVMINQPVTPGEKITVEVEEALGHGSMLLATIVRWNHGRNHGLELLSPTTAQQHILRQLIPPPN